MRYSVVTLTSLNRLPSLQACIGKIRAGARTPPDDYEIIVVDNGCTDGTGPWLDLQPDIRTVHRQENEGVCARNHGLEIARGDYIIQVDDDVLVVPGFDDILLGPYQNPIVGATGPHGFYQDSTWGLLIDDRRRPAPGQFCDLVMGYCWSWRNIRASNDRAVRLDGAAAIEIPGPSRFLYDWDFSPFWHEETALQMEIRYAGYRIAVVPPVATHRTLHDWAETKRDGPVTGLSIAERNFWKLVDKWKDKDIHFEGPSVGLVGPAPGKRATR